MPTGSCKRWIPEDGSPDDPAALPLARPQGPCTTVTNGTMKVGPNQILLVVLLVLLLFGGKKIPELMRGLGKGMKEFKDAQKDDKDAPEDKS